MNLIDEVDVEKELKEIGEALADVDKFPRYVREKSSKAISNFLVSKASTHFSHRIACCVKDF